MSYSHFIIRRGDSIVIERRILWHYIPIVRVDSFHDALEAISNFSYSLRYSKAIVYDPDGPNPRMVIKYWRDKRMDIFLKIHPSSLKVQPIINKGTRKLLILLNSIYQQLKINWYENKMFHRRYSFAEFLCLQFRGLL